MHSFQVYDADAYARSHYHLLQRHQAASSSPSVMNMALANATFANVTIENTTNGNATANSTISNATLSLSSLALPGAPGRWRLPPDSTGLNSYARMLHQIDLMSQAYTLYYFLQVCGREFLLLPNFMLCRFGKSTSPLIEDPLFNFLICHPCITKT